MASDGSHNIPPLPSGLDRHRARRIVLGAGCQLADRGVVLLPPARQRWVHLLIPLAFTPPQTLAAIVAGSGSTDLTVTALSQAIPYAWRS
jgi:hypothetical protein